MRKGIITATVVAVVIAVVVFALPGVTGRNDKSLVRNEVKLLSGSPTVEAKLTSFQHGFYTSKGTILVSLVNARGSNRPVVRLHQVIRHGPWPEPMLSPVLAVVHSRLDILGKNGKPVSHPSFEPITARTVIDLDRDSDTAIHAKPWHGVLQASNGNKADLAWKGMSGDIRVESGLTGVREHVHLGAFTANGSGNRFTLGAIDMHTHASRNKGDLFWAGHSHTTIKRVSMHSSNQNPSDVTVKRISWHYDLGKQKKTMSIHNRIDVDSVRTNNGKVGPAHLDFTLSNINRKALASMHKRIRKIESMRISQKRKTKALEMTVFQSANDLLKYSPELKVAKLSLTTGKGTGTMKGDVKLLGGSIPVGAGSWKHRFQGRLDLTFPTAWIRSTEKLDGASSVARGAYRLHRNLAAMEQRGLVKCRQHKCETHVRYDRGDLVVNGRDLSQ